MLEFILRLNLILLIVNLWKGLAVYSFIGKHASQIIISTRKILKIRVPSFSSLEDVTWLRLAVNTLKKFVDGCFEVEPTLKIVDRTEEFLLSLK